MHDILKNFAVSLYPFGYLCIILLYTRSTHTDKNTTSISQRTHRKSPFKSFDICHFYKCG
nr:MAG TPA: hypothetical protein [Caudoviricetes sp.]